MHAKRRVGNELPSRRNCLCESGFNAIAGNPWCLSRWNRSHNAAIRAQYVIQLYAPRRYRLAINPHQHSEKYIMNRKIKILGVLHLILGGGGMAACMAAYLNWIKIASDAHSLRTAHTLGQMMFMLSMFILLPSLVCGIGLLFEKSWGRVVAIGWSMLLLLVIPIGTLLGGYGLWVLLKQPSSSAYPAGSETSSRPYHPHDFEPRPTSALTAMQPPLKGRARLLPMMLIVGASMIVLLRVGFWIAGQQPPSVIVEPVQIAAVLLFAIVVALIVVAVRSGLTRSTATAIGATAMGRGLTRSSHVPLNERLQHEAAVAPELPLGSDAICIHVQPIERLMRGVGIRITQPSGRDAQAYCQVDRAELALVFGTGIAELYRERHDIDRSYLDPKTALFWCAACNSRLWVVHADAATDQTPWFPENALAARTNADVRHL